MSSETPAVKAPIEIDPTQGFRRDPKGNMIAEVNIKPQDLLMDQTVDKIVGYALDLSAQVARFKGHTYEDIGTFFDILREEHGVEKSMSEKGNLTLTSFDGLQRVTVKANDNIEFGPEIKVAKELIDELIDEWSEGASNELRTIVQSAFDTSKTGHINKDAIFRLKRLEFDDPRWKTVQQLITDSVRSYGSKSYILVHRRANPREKWQLVPISLASA